MYRVAVDIGGRARVSCVVARTASEQARGLQGYPGLSDGEGMLFPFAPARAATFHMGRVAFPIDLVFSDAAGRIVGVVHHALPGTRERWSQPVCSAVVEVAGGLCRRQGVQIGQDVRILGQRVGTQTYNLLRTLTEASVDDDNALADGYYSKEPNYTPPGGAKRRVAPEDQFQHARLPDEQPNAMDQPNEHFVQNEGYVRPFDTAPTYNVRPSMQARWATLEVDPVEFVPVMLEAAARTGLRWEDVALNERIERAIIRPADVGDWVHRLGLVAGAEETLFRVATSEPGLDAIGTGFIAAGAADLARVFSVGDQHLLELTRGK